MGVLRKLVDVEDDDVEDVDVDDDEVDLAGACGVEDEPVLPEDLAGAFGDELTEVWALAVFLSDADLAAALAEVEALGFFLDLDFGLDCFVV